MSDPIDYTRIHKLAVQLAKKTAPSFRDSPDRNEIATLCDALRQYASSADDTSRPLTERVKCIYPVIHRAYDLFVGTKQGDGNADSRKLRAKGGWFGKKKFRLEVADNCYWGLKYSDCGSIICLGIGNRNLYGIMRLRPEWKRTDPHYTKRYVAKREEGVSVTPDDCIDICSIYFKINCLPPEDFARALVAGSSQPQLRQNTLEHLLFLPEILGPYLDRKERGEIVR